MRTNNIIVKPLLTEKASGMTKDKVYTFIVNPKATKYQVSATIEGIYKVKVDSVRIARRVGKVKRVGKGMQEKKRPDKKIAFITLREGSIDVFPQS